MRVYVVQECTSISWGVFSSIEKAQEHAQLRASTGDITIEGWDLDDRSRRCVEYWIWDQQVGTWSLYND